MLQHILVPLDGSSRAESALPHAHALARAFNARISLLHVLEPPQDRQGSQTVDPLTWRLREVEASAYLNQVAEQLRASDFAVEEVLVEGDAASTIIEFATTHDVDLLLLTSHGHTNISLWNVSSIVAKVLQSSGVSIMIVRAFTFSAPEQEISYHKLLVPLDGSRRAESALPVATQLAEQSGAELLLAHVVKRPEMPRRAPLSAEEQSLVDQVVSHNQREMQAYLEQFHLQLGLAPETHLRVSDDVADSLHHLIDEEAVDLLVLCAHGYSGSRRWPLGTVATNLLLYGSTPLMVVQDLSIGSLEPSLASVAAKEPLGRLAHGR